MITDIPTGHEAHKLISISLGKIAASRCRRSGSSLHKSLLVASVLHKARFVYFEEAHQNGLCCPPSIQQAQHEEDLNSLGPQACAAIPIIPEVSVTPVSVSETDNEENDFPTSESTSTTLESSVHENEGEDTLDYSYSNCSNKNSLIITRKRCRDTSDQEIEAAVSSILPKRLKSNLSDEEDLEECHIELCSTPSEYCSSCNNDSSSIQIINNDSYSVDDKEPHVIIEPANINSDYLCSFCGSKNSDCQCSDHSNSDEGEEEDYDLCNSMEVDHITSLVSIFSFNSQQTSSDQLCSTQVLQQESAVGLPVVALTA